MCSSDLNSANDFAVAYYQQENPQDNYCFSPYSLFSGLSLAYLGAEGETAIGMEKGLHLTLSKKELAFSLERVKETSLFEGEYMLKMADALWIEKDIQLKEDYLFGANVERLPLNAKDPKGSSNAINQWVEEKTAGKISHLVAKEEITKDTKLLLTNALYFQDRFLSPFNHKNTKQKPFLDEMTEMMEQTNSFPYYEDEMLQLLITPMASEKYGCFFLLPKGPLKELEKGLSSLEKIPFSTEETRVHIELPKFSINMKSKPKASLTKLGMEEAFSLQANFSGITDDAKLKIDEVLHEALFELSEEIGRAHV